MIDMEMIYCHVEAEAAELGPDGLRELADNLDDIANNLRMDAYEKERAEADAEANITDGGRNP